MFVNTRQQGDWGELSAASWFTSKGAMVAWPVGHSPDWDLLIDWHECLYRVQVKTTKHQTKAGNWSVAICTRGGNQSWNRIVKRFAPSRCDYLFAHVADGRRWCIPSDRVQGTTVIVLGGRPYSEFEVEPADRLPNWSPIDHAA